MSQDLFGFTQEGAQRIVDAVRTVENSTSEFSTPNDDDDQSFQVQGKLNGALSAGTSFAQNPPTAELQVYVPDPDSANNNQLIDAGYTVTVTNRDPKIIKAQNDWCRAVFVNGEWQPHGGGGCSIQRRYVCSSGNLIEQWRYCHETAWTTSSVTPPPDD